jgi:hypothetical protein
MKWISKMKFGKNQLFPSAEDKVECEADEGSSTMFTVIGPIKPHTDTSVPPASCSPAALHCTVPSARIETAPPVQSQPVKKMMKLFDDTAYTDESKFFTFG